jgi:hypothetical protein
MMCRNLTSYCVNRSKAVEQPDCDDEPFGVGDLGAFRRCGPTQRFRKTLKLAKSFVSVSVLALWGCESQPAHTLSCFGSLEQCFARVSKHDLHQKSSLEGQNRLDRCILISGSVPPPSMGVLLSSVPSGVYGVCPQGLLVPIPVGRPQSSLPHLPPNRIANSSPSPKATERVESATASPRSARQVSPEVAGIIERVLVPALVKRYIAQLSSTGNMVG